MKRLHSLLLTLLVCLAAATLSGCSSAGHPLEEMATELSPEALAAAPRPEAPEALQTRDTFTLYFRYLNEPLLAQEARSIAHSPDQSVERALVAALVGGPDVQSPWLEGLFPPGTRVLSTLRQGRTLFVTFNQQLMNAYPDEPDSWEEDPRWRTEAPLRRRLCMQSLVATITENCDVDSVVVLVEQQTVTDSLRLRAAFYLDRETPSAIAPPLQRDDALLLSPGTAMQTILTCWQNRDWLRLSRYLSDDAELTALPHLIDVAFTGPTLSPDGQTATFTLSGTIRRNGVDSAFAGCILRLQKAGGLWLLPPHQLTAFKED